MATRMELSIDLPIYIYRHMYKDACIQVRPPHMHM